MLTTQHRMNLQSNSLSGQAHTIFGIGLLIWFSGQIALLRRSLDPEKGYWTIPGGAVEAGESAADAAVRELLEELGLDGIRLTPVGIIEAVSRATPDTIVSLVFSGQSSTPPTNAEELSHGELGLFHPGMLPSPRTRLTEITLNRLLMRKGPARRRVTFVQDTLDD